MTANAPVEEFRLSFIRKFADLIKEQGALVRALDEPFFRPDGPGKDAFCVSEELALEEILWQSRAAERNQLARQTG